jgi:glycosyltransferase involved in cell wall biosynthesis
MSRISIVTTSLNHAAFLGETLESVRAQGYADLEHLVLDGGSSDGTLALLQARSGPDWQQLRWISEPDGGQTQAMNKGLRMATGDIIGWLNSDDRYRPGCLETVAKVFAQNPGIDVLYGDYTFMDERGVHMRVRREIEFSRLVLLYHHAPHIPTTSTFFRRSIFDDGNWLDESFQYAMDHEFFVRLATKGYRFKHVPAVLADFRLHSSSKTCAMGARQLAEGRMAMYKYSPIALGVRNRALRTLCLGTLQIAAAIARCTEKFVRGYYLPERIAERVRPTR